MREFRQDRGFRGETMADEIVECPYSYLSVIPVKTGIQHFYKFTYIWIPAYAGMTTFCEVING